VFALCEYAMWFSLSMVQCLILEVMMVPVFSASNDPLRMRN
jgi:hypothetical protein